MTRNKSERNDEVLTIPDFDTSEEMRVALRELRKNEPRLYRKLLSDDAKYVQLRNELFPTGENFKKL